MNDQITYFKDFNDVIARLSKVFSELESEELRDLLFFLAEFRKNNKIPEDIEIYTMVLPLEGLEVQSAEKVSRILVGGVDKYIDLKYPKKNLSPIVIVKGTIRLIIMYGEMSAIEAYLRKQPIKALVFDVGDRDPFEVFKLDELGARFLVPLIQEREEKK